MKYILMSLIAITISCSSVNPSIDNGESKVAVQNESIAKDISIQEFKNLIGEDAIILDVRTKGEYDAGHLKNAINIDWFSENFLVEVANLDKNKKLLIHCASGGRSSKAMNKLKSSGFNVMYNMLGGFNAWKSAGYEFEK